MTPTPPARKRCPICDAALDQPGSALADYRPFCSRRCADVDLQRWFSGRYAIPGGRGEDAEQSGPDPHAEPNADPDAELD